MSSYKNFTESVLLDWEIRCDDHSFKDLHSSNVLSILLILVLWLKMISSRSKRRFWKPDSLGKHNNVGWLLPTQTTIGSRTSTSSKLTPQSPHPLNHWLLVPLINNVAFQSSLWTTARKLYLDMTRIYRWGKLVWWLILRWELACINPFRPSSERHWHLNFRSWWSKAMRVLVTIFG
jgi:hypothetical protein